MSNCDILQTPNKSGYGAENLIGTEVWGTVGDIGFTRDGSHKGVHRPAQGSSATEAPISIYGAGRDSRGHLRTAWLCVIDAAGLSAGETLLVIGATGGVGSAAMQMLTR